MENIFVDISCVCIGIWGLAFLLTLLRFIARLGGRNSKYIEYGMNGKNFPPLGG